MLASAGDAAEDRIPVAIETARGAAGRGAARRRAAGLPGQPAGGGPVPGTHLGVGQKGDHAGAMALAIILRTDAHLHRRLPGDSAVDNDHVPASALTGGGPPESPALARLATGGYPIAW